MHMYTGRGIRYHRAMNGFDELLIALPSIVPASGEGGFAGKSTITAPDARKEGFSWLFFISLTYSTDLREEVFRRIERGRTENVIIGQTPFAMFASGVPWAQLILGGDFLDAFFASQANEAGHRMRPYHFATLLYFPSLIVDPSAIVRTENRFVVVGEGRHDKHPDPGAFFIYLEPRPGDDGRDDLYVTDIRRLRRPWRLLDRLSEEGQVLYVGKTGAYAKRLAERLPYGVHTKESILTDAAPKDMPILLAPGIWHGAWTVFSWLGYHVYHLDEDNPAEETKTFARFNRTVPVVLAEGDEYERLSMELQGEDSVVLRRPQELLQG